ncbi:MAG: UDP-N-acetylmuramoyl-L-alanine--D-glutamate ligase [Desulfobacterales bacterium]|nr:UDP-N-acetylmuramoyl-L-alanine--D-glutamate ligase [Desulfobacterales bacterium]MBF0396049.1 UDP-N-acetylmuramoyl-L-alanine--D-glutamate ligase [Desulfobacterales bacterium]
MEIVNKNILIVGLARTGIATARFLKNKGAFVIVTDIAKEENLPNAKEAKDLGINMELGVHKIETFLKADLIILSPGVSHTIFEIQRAREKGTLIVGELELASWFIKEPIVAITGTNGKTTTTELTYKMLMESGFKVFVGGNIGNPLIGYIEKEEKREVVVAEVSSFQLDTIQTFKPKVSAILNITEDHMDRYKNFEEYIESKGTIFKNQDSNDFAVLNYDDLYVRGLVDKIKSRKLFFSSSFEFKNGATIDANSSTITFYIDGIKKELFTKEDFNLFGKHNLENIAAAVLSAFCAGASFQGVRNALKNFKGLPHRIEYVDTICGVKYFDDSKGTNIDAVFRALEVFTDPVILIMGGRDKGGSFHLLQDRVKERVKNLILIGESKKDIRKGLGHVVPTEDADNMEDAVLKASKKAKAGDIVLLSPACASFDMYKNYAERGKDFCRAVSLLKQ